MHGPPTDPELEAPSAPGPLVDDGGGVGGDPLRGRERAVYGTDHRAADGDELPPRGADSRAWIVLGLALLVVFLAILAWAVIRPFA